MDRVLASISEVAGLRTVWNENRIIPMWHFDVVKL